MATTALASAIPLIVNETVPRASAATTWDFAADFGGEPSPANPAPDSLGNPDVWSYLDGTAHNPATYVLLSRYTPSGCGNGMVDAWDTPTEFPVVLHNRGAATSCSTDSQPAGGGFVHPSESGPAIVAWKSPFSGVISITGSVDDADDNCGDGIVWSIDRGPTTLASGAIANGGTQEYRAGSGGGALASQTVAAGDQFFLVVEPKGDYVCDTTQVSLTITGQDSPPPTTTTTSTTSTTTTTSTTVPSTTSTTSSTTTTTSAPTTTTTTTACDDDDFEPDDTAPGGNGGPLSGQAEFAGVICGDNPDHFFLTDRRGPLCPREVDAWVGATLHYAGEGDLDLLLTANGTTYAAPESPSPEVVAFPLRSDCASAPPRIEIQVVRRSGTRNTYTVAVARSDAPPSPASNQSSAFTIAPTSGPAMSPNSAGTTIAATSTTPCPGGATGVVGSLVDRAGQRGHLATAALEGDSSWRLELSSGVAADGPAVFQAYCVGPSGARMKYPDQSFNVTPNTSAPVGEVVFGLAPTSQQPGAAVTAGGLITDLDVQPLNSAGEVVVSGVPVTGPRRQASSCRDAPHNLTVSVAGSSVLTSGDPLDRWRATFIAPDLPAGSAVPVAVRCRDAGTNAIHQGTTTLYIEPRLASPTVTWSGRRATITGVGCAPRAGDTARVDVAVVDYAQRVRGTIQTGFAPVVTNAPAQHYAHGRAFQPPPQIEMKPVFRDVDVVGRVFDTGATVPAGRWTVQLDAPTLRRDIGVNAACIRGAGGDDIAIYVPVGGPGSDAPSSSGQTAAPGGRVRISGGGYAPRSTAKATFRSDPVDLGIVTMDDAGSFDVEFTIPPAATPGVHHVVVTGIDPAGAPRELRFPVVVVGGTLQRTGIDPLPGAVVASALIGVGWLTQRAAGRRRRLGQGEHFHRA